MCRSFLSSNSLSEYIARETVGAKVLQVSGWQDFVDQELRRDSISVIVSGVETGQVSLSYLGNLASLSAWQCLDWGENECLNTLVST